MNLGQNVCLEYLWVRFSKCYYTQVSFTGPSWPSCYYTVVVFCVCVVCDFKNKSPIFVLLCALCFQMQRFLFLSSLLVPL